MKTKTKTKSNKNANNFFIKLTQEIKKCRVYKEDTLYKKINKIK